MKGVVIIRSVNRGVIMEKGADHCEGVEWHGRIPGLDRQRRGDR